MAAASPAIKPPAPMDSDLQGRESLLPKREKPPRHGKPEKRPAPSEKPDAPANEESKESPSGDEDKAECDECVLVFHRSGADNPDRSESGDGRAYASAGGLGLASTLWGLFCVGRPRLFQRKRPNGQSAP